MDSATETAINKLLFVDVDSKETLDIKEEKKSPPLKDESIKPKSNLLRCEECHYTSIGEDQMTRHIRKVHRGEKPFQCKDCSYGTTNSVMYKEHCDTHLGLKPYKCKHCDYRSVSKKYIKMHESKHGACECGYIAKNKSALRRHILEKDCITGKKEFHCTQCDLMCDSYKTLHQHTKKCHRKCSYCEETFEASALKQHLVEVHRKAKQSVAKRFHCKLCEWESSSVHQIQLHLIHHPSQELDVDVDITPLVKAGILVGHSDK